MQHILMERSTSMTHELEAICSPGREQLGAVDSPVRSRSAEPQAMCKASVRDSDSEDGEAEPESPVATHNDPHAATHNDPHAEHCSLGPEKSFSSPSRVRGSCMHEASCVAPSVAQRLEAYNSRRCVIVHRLSKHHCFFALISLRCLHALKITQKDPSGSTCSTRHCTW